MSISIGGAINASTSKISGNTQTINNMSGDIKQAETVYVTELYFNSYKEFPTIGETTKLYVDTGGNAIYRFDNTKNIYVCTGRDYQEIEAIQSKLKEE